MNSEATCALRTDIDLDKVKFFSPELLADPYDLFVRLRKERPVAKFFHPVFERDQYVVTTYALLDEVYRDSARFSSHYIDMVTGGGKGNPEAAAVLATSWPEVDTLLTSDEPDHTRLRSLVAKAFMPTRIQRMADLIDRIIADLINGFVERGECDFVREFAIPLPINSIGEVLGIPSSYYGKIYDWTFSLLRRFGQMGTFEEQLHDAHQIVELKAFVASLVREREKYPKDDLISDLVSARVDGHKPLSELEILSTVLLLILGGAETTRSTLISAMAQLMLHPAQLELLLRDMSLCPKLIEETLRHDTPGSANWRVATRDTVLGGVTIPKGAMLMLRMDSAGRDESVFENPEAFDLRRRNLSSHLSFGKGIHFCIGFRLAREQVTRSFQALLTRLQNIKMIKAKSDLRIHPSSHMRCMRELYLSFVPGKPAANERRASA